MSSHTYNLRKCIETEGKFCDIKKNYKAPRCPSSAAPNSVVPSSSQRTQTLLNGTLKENNPYTQTIINENVTINNNSITLEQNKKYKINFIVNSKEGQSDSVTLEFLYDTPGNKKEYTILQGTINKQIFIEFETQSNTLIQIGEFSSDSGSYIDSDNSSIIISQVTISYDEVISCPTICNDESGNLKKNTLLYNGSYAQYLKNNYNA